MVALVPVDRPERPWVGTEVPCGDIDRPFFRISTQVTVGDG